MCLHVMGHCFSGADLGGHPAGFCPALPHGQSLCSRRGGELPARVSAFCLPHFTAELAKEAISQTPGMSVWGAAGCGFGVVRKQPSTVLPLQGSGGGRKRRRERNFGAAEALNLLLVKSLVPGWLFPVFCIYQRSWLMIYQFVKSQKGLGWKGL